jgi:DNA-binding transcriptional LysR family regulator
MALTEAGEIYYAHIDRILEELQQADKIVSDFQSMPQGTLCIETRGGLASSKSSS